MTDMTSIERQLERIELKLDKAIDDHERRLRALERWVYIASGLALTGTGTGIASLFSILSGGGG